MLKVDFLRAAGFILDIAVDMTRLDDCVKGEYLKRKSTEQEYIDKHLKVTDIKYDKITNITHVIAELDDEAIKKFKSGSKDYRIMEQIKNVANICREINCANCPYGEGLGCALSKADGLPYTWKFLLD